MLMQQLIYTMQKLGVMEFYFPFLLTFSIFYALLQKSGVFGKEEWATKINAIVAFVAAFYVMGYTNVGFKIAEFLMPFFTQTTVAVVTLLAIAMILGMASGSGLIPKADELTNRTKQIISIAMVLIGVYIFVSSGGLKAFGVTGGMPGIGLSSEDIMFLVIVGVTILLIYVVVNGFPETKCG